MHVLTRQQALVVASLTLVWGLNWPILKLGVTGYPPLTFRTLSIALGVPLLAGVMVAMKVGFRVPRKHWRELLLLALTNMVVWHVCVIIALKDLTGGRAAILGYTMPIFSAVVGALFFRNALVRRSWVGVTAAAVAVSLLLWHEFTHLTGAPGAVLMVLLSAAVWGLGTQLMRRTRMDVATLTIVFWMTCLTLPVMAVLAVLREQGQWSLPTRDAMLGIAYNAVMIFGLAQPAWFFLARSLPPVASTLSVMLIPVVGVFSGALWLHEPLYWQDWAAVVLILFSIACVLWPTSAARSD